MKKFVIIVALSACCAISSIAQQGDKKMDMETLKALLEQAGAKKMNVNTPANKSKNNTSAKTNSNVSAKYTRNPAHVKYKKSTIDNAYKYLTDAEKEQVKNLPPIPIALRTNIDAQEFLIKLNGIDLKSEVQKSAAAKSITLLGFYMSYQTVITKAEYIVSEAKKLEAAFIQKNGVANFGKGVGKTYVSENDLVYLPLGDASFADEVIDTKFTTGNLKFPSENCLNNPDFLEGKKIADNTGVYSLGLNGSLIIQFTNNALIDVNGPDLFVFEAGEIEPTNLEISKNGTDWITVGKIEGGTAAVDIAGFAKPNEYYYYVRLTDLNTKSTIAGADIDAIAAIGSAMRLSLEAEVLFDLGKADLKPKGLDAIKKLAANVANIKDAVIIIVGHTDDVGDADANQQLSLARAQSVSTILKQALGNNTQFVYQEIGKGETEPTAPNNSDANRKKNRRVEIIIKSK
jgi:flagellar motor protein MotB